MIAKKKIESLSVNKFYFFSLLLIFFYSTCIQAYERPIVVIIPSYKNIKWYENNLDSVYMQKYSNYRVIYIDDNSPDGTGKAVERYVRQKKQGHRTKVLRNSERLGALANIYYGVHSCEDKEIVVLLDGDDWAYHDKVFKNINQAYSKGNVWFTHGTLIEYPWGNVSWCEPIAAQALAEKNYRKYKCPSHLRTFYAWLFKKIKLEDFQYNGSFLTMAWDMAIMFPLAEMAEERHCFIKETNYVYNMANPINDNKVDPGLQNFLDKLIRNRPAYQRLEESDIPVLN